MNTRTNLIQLFINDLRSINATLRDITPTTVSNDIATTKITGLIKKWDAHQQYLSKLLTKGSNDIVITDMQHGIRSKCDRYYYESTEKAGDEYDHATTVLPTDEQDDKYPKGGQL